MKKWILTLVALSIFSQVWSQEVHECGIINYERRFSIKKALTESKDGNENPWMDEIIRMAPKFKIDQFTMLWSPGKSRYIFKENSDKSKSRMWGGDVAQHNEVYKDFSTAKQYSLKEIFEGDYLIEDTIHRFTWKITNEYREIAGYSCRRATCVIQDSLYVIAYYSEDLASSSGPESFGGLPGMIMGIVMPRMNTTWFATDVRTECNRSGEIIKPVKGKKIQMDVLNKKLEEEFGRSKKWYQKMIWNLLI